MPRTSYFSIRYMIIFGLFGAAILILAAFTFSRVTNEPVTTKDYFSGLLYNLSNSQTSPDGLWYAVSNGGGTMGVTSYKEVSDKETNVFYEMPTPPTIPKDSHSALALTVESFHDFHLSADVRTQSQIRENSQPKSWEVAWIIWHWKDNTHFNYFLVKTNGAEIGKYDGGSNPNDQIILQSVSHPKAEIGKWMHWEIITQGDRMSVRVNGDQVFDLNDTSSFQDGKIGLYCEDSISNFANFHVEDLSQKSQQN